jgi:hypothetical protein
MLKPCRTSEGRMIGRTYDKSVKKSARYMTFGLLLPGNIRMES